MVITTQHEKKIRTPLETASVRWFWSYQSSVCDVKIHPFCCGATVTEQRPFLQQFSIKACFYFWSLIQRLFKSSLVVSESYFEKLMKTGLLLALATWNLSVPCEGLERDLDTSKRETHVYKLCKTKSAVNSPHRICAPITVNSLWP